MKLTVIGDIHGRRQWKKAVKDQSDSDLFVFIGDYFDSYLPEVSYEDEIENFKEIVSFKKDNMDKVVLLLGNHDYHYLDFPGSHNVAYSRYRHRGAGEIGAILNECEKLDLFKVCFMLTSEKEGHLLFVHAGVSQTWLEDHALPMHIDDTPEKINKLFKEDKLPFGFIYGENLSPYGNDITQSPFWIRPEALLSDLPLMLNHKGELTKVRQVIGHTQVHELKPEVSEKIIMVDALGQTGQYLIIEDGEFKVGETNVTDSPD